MDILARGMYLRSNGGRCYRVVSLRPVNTRSGKNRVVFRCECVPEIDPTRPLIEFSWCPRKRKPR